MEYKYEKDAAFLELMDKEHLKEQYAKIILLDWQENPIQEIQGVVTGGNLNIDGKSSMRRTCNLTITVNDDENASVTNMNNLFSINKKIKLEIGYKNTTKQYPEYDIIWYRQGVFVIINPSVSHSLSGTTISLQLKDKMCLLNGECGGTIPASTQFDKYETIDEEGKYIIERPIIIQIIRELVNHFGGESLNKIIISDIDNRIKKVMKWTGSNPLYYVKSLNIMTMNYSEVAGKTYEQYEYGQDVGYIYTDFYYPTELIANAGDTVVTILDKIKNTLGNFEYFYDIDGNFVFREIKNYLNTTQATVDLNSMRKENYIVDMSKGKSVYNFDNSNLVTSYSNSPQFNMIKNDFVVWGIRKNASGNNVPIRYHLAIDKKPKVGNIYEGFIYEDPDDKLTKVKVPIKYKNWLELNKHNGVEGNLYMTTDNNYVFKWNPEEGVYEMINVGLSKIKTTDWRSELYLQGTQADPLAIDSNYYYTELLNEWPKLYDFKSKSEIINGETVYTGNYYPEVLKNPNDIDFYLDIIDSDTTIGQFNVSNIGRRSKVENNNDINCIFEPDIPDVIFIEIGLEEETEKKRRECEAKGQNYIQVNSSIFELLALGGSSNSAFNEIRDLLYQYTSYNESITLQTIPIFHLEPNTRITVRDEKSDIYGDYMISTISIPLGVGSNISISATRALEKF